MIICNCLRCGHEWASRKVSRPGRCASCGAKYWWRVARIPKLYPPPLRPGRPTKYPVHLLNVGQQVTLEWPGNIVSMKQSISAYARRHNKQFKLISTIGGLKVSRVL